VSRAWAVSPFYLGAGNRLAQLLTAIDIHFEPNVLSLRIQPDEGISLRFVAKAPGELRRPATA
jgi:glucose-6-phosphate 1-dehydrogenase